MQTHHLYRGEWDKQILLSSRRLHDVICKLPYIYKVTMPIQKGSDEGTVHLFV